MDPVTFNEEAPQKTAAKKAPLRLFFLAFRHLTISEKTKDPAALKSAKRALDFMLDEYQPATREAEVLVGSTALTMTEESKLRGGQVWTASSAQ